MMWGRSWDTFSSYYLNVSSSVWKQYSFHSLWSCVLVVNQESAYMWVSLDPRLCSICHSLQYCHAYYLLLWSFWYLIKQIFLIYTSLRLLWELFVFYIYLKVAWHFLWRKKKGILSDNAKSIGQFRES